MTGPVVHWFRSREQVQISYTTSIVYGIYELILIASRIAEK